MKFTVKVAITYHKELLVNASDEDEASEKAEEIVSKWNNVEEVETLDITPCDI